MHLHIWTWGDEARHWTPVRVEGINGAADLRLQRYLAARLGLLPGWTISYGFDLNDWVITDQVSRRHEHLQEEMGRGHLLGARADNHFEPPPTLDLLAHDRRIEDRFYESAVELLEEADGRPGLLERRFSFLRDDVWDMKTTRRAFWQFTLASGVGESRAVGIGAGIRPSGAVVGRHGWEPVFTRNEFTGSPRRGRRDGLGSVHFGMGNLSGLDDGEGFAGVGLVCGVVVGWVYGSEAHASRLGRCSWNAVRPARAGQAKAAVKNRCIGQPLLNASRGRN